MSSFNRARRRRRGSVLLTALIGVMVVGALAASMAVAGGSRTRERDAAVHSTRALYVAEAGMSEAIERISRGELAAVVGQGPSVAFGGGEYAVEVVDNGDNTVTVTSQAVHGRSARATQATLELVGEGIFASALFAGNSSGDPNYSMRFGGTGSSADAITGNVYSGGNIAISGTPTFNGTLRASGAVTGGSFPADNQPITGSTQPIPDIAGMNYETNHDYDVAAMFSSATWTLNSSLGGRAWQLPQSSPAHIFRKNPNDRTTNTSSTVKDDYFLEDPYESVNGSSTVSPANSTRITLSGAQGKPGVDGSNRVYYIDGNLWIHNNNIFSFTMYNAGSSPVRVTFVVKGNIYFSDNILYQGTRPDGLAFIAINDDAVEDSGNIYFGDPSFGTLEQMDAFMYAENNFYDSNLSATGSAKVTVNGNMTAGNQVRINRDYGTKHSKLTVNYDGRLLDNTITLPGLPSQSGATPTWFVRSWAEVTAVHP
jgi:Tfp pilus assembly protein PilX